MADEKGLAIVVELSVHRPVKARLPLSVNEAHEYLEAENRDVWLDEYLDAHADATEVEDALLHAYEIEDATYDGPDSVDDLPPRVHRDQLTIDALT